MRFILSIICFIALTMSFAVQADTIRSGSVTVSFTSDTDFDLVWRVPARNQKKLNLVLSVPEDTVVTKTKTGHFLQSYYVESWSGKRAKGIEDFYVQVDGLLTITANVIVRIIKPDGTIKTDVLSGDNNVTQLTAADKHQSTALTYIILGVEHILIGLDHLLFVACLIFIAGKPKRLLYTITGFTTAHSVTLFGTSLGWFYLPVPPIEASIALSIVFLAVEIVKNRQDGLTLRYPIVVSSSFGLLHGFGFASVLNDIGLPKDEKIWALLNFNVGVEIGQILFISALVALFLLVKKVIKTIDMAQLRRPIAYCCGTLSMYWLIERVMVF